MTTAAQALTSRPLLGILFMCLASSVFPAMNGLVQVLSERYGVEQIAWVRMGGHLLFVVALFAPRHGFRIVATARPGLQLSRSLLMLTTTMLFFAGLAYLPLAKASSISFTSPFLVVLLAWPLLGERVTIPRLAAVIVAFAGVLVVLRPGGDVFHWASLLILASAATYALDQVLTRRVAGFDRPETTVIYSALVGTIVLSFIAVFTWIWPQSWVDGGLMLLVGILGGIGQYFVAKSMTYAPANVVAPFMYWQMVGAVIVGYLVSGSMPDLGTWIGAAIIISAGLFVGWRDARESGRPAYETP